MLFKCAVPANVNAGVTFERFPSASPFNVSQWYYSLGEAPGTHKSYTVAESCCKPHAQALFALFHSYFSDPACSTDELQCIMPYFKCPSIRRMEMNAFVCVSGLH